MSAAEDLELAELLERQEVAKQRAAVAEREARPEAERDRPARRGVVAPLAELVSFGPEPAWVRCIGCNGLAVTSPCIDCAREADRRAERATERLIGVASIPEGFADLTVRTPDLADRVDSRTRPLPELIQRILAAGRVVLGGGSGAGKTTLAVACLRERREPGRFVSAIELATARTQHGLGDGDASLVDLAIAAPLLLIDDLGEEVNTRTSAVKDVIRRRYDMMRPTWVTTGFRPSELVAKYGDGIKRRLFEPRGTHDRVCAEWLGPRPTITGARS